MAQFPFVAADTSAGDASLLPFLPIELHCAQQSFSTSGLLDTGAAVNVLPFEAGLKLGLVWEAVNMPVRLTGNLAAEEARVVVVGAQIADFKPVRLAFAWTRAQHVPLILGQVNFFLEFDACFYRSRNVFEVNPR